MDKSKVPHFLAHPVVRTYDFLVVLFTALFIKWSCWIKFRNVWGLHIYCYRKHC